MLFQSANSQYGYGKIRYQEQGQPERQNPYSAYDDRRTKTSYPTYVFSLCWIF